MKSFSTIDTMQTYFLILMNSLLGRRAERSNVFWMISSHYHQMIIISKVILLTKSSVIVNSVL